MKSDEKFTYADYKLWPEGERWELIDGVAYGMSPAPKKSHQTLSMQLSRQLDAFFEGKPCRPLAAPLDVFWPEEDSDDLDATETVTQPDLLVVCDPTKLTEDGVRGAPDFVIEILSPTTAYKDQTEKRELHERHGVREFWLINPKTFEVMIYTLKDGAYGLPQMASLRNPVPVGIFPGLELKARIEEF